MNNFSDNDFNVLFEVWTTHIPLVTAMGIEFKHNPDHWFLEAPLEPNRNHMGTGFGGSISALATLAGWAQTWMMLASPGDVDIVISKSAVRFLKPATGRLIGTAAEPDEHDAQRFSRRLQKRGRASLDLVTHVHSNDIAVASFEGRFVATMKSRP